MWYLVVACVSAAFGYVLCGLLTDGRASDVCASLDAAYTRAIDDLHRALDAERKRAAAAEEELFRESMDTDTLR